MTVEDALKAVDLGYGAMDEPAEVLAAEVRRLRQRHAKAVEAAFREAWANGYVNGLDPNRRNVTCDAAWLASEAKARLT